MSASVSSHRSSSSHKSHTSHHSTSSHRSSKSSRSHKSHSSQKSNRSIASAPPSVSSKHSTGSQRSSSKKGNGHLDSIPENLYRSSSLRENYAESKSDSRRKSSTSSSRRNINGSSSFVTTSSRSVLSTPSVSTTASSRTKQCDTYIVEAANYFAEKKYVLSALTYTRVLLLYNNNNTEFGNPLEGGTEERLERKLGGIYVARAECLSLLAEEVGLFGISSCEESLNKSERSLTGSRRSSGMSVKSITSRTSAKGTETGMYAAIARDARMALECERASACKLTLQDGGKRQQQEEGALVRSKALCLLAYSLLRRGTVEGVSEAFEGSMDVATKERNSKSEENGTASIQQELEQIVQLCKDGLAELGRYEMLSARLKKENRSRHNVYFHDLEDILKVAPVSDKWNSEMIRMLRYQGRWFAVANYCERMACKLLEVEGVFEGDLKEFHLFSAGIGRDTELTIGFFEKGEEKGGEAEMMGLPPYLRVVSDKAAGDVVLRIPENVVSIYLRALRLEDRLNAGQVATAALIEAGGWRKECAEAEVALLETTTKLKGEADELFRDGTFERAAGLYEQCLKVDKDKDPGGKLHAVLHSNRASCYSSLGRYEEAIAECTAALDGHSMYMKALLRRARCYAKVGDMAKCADDYQRWNMLVEKARRQPYPGFNVGPACFFDMPADIKTHDWNTVKSEMSELGISLSTPTNGMGGSLRNSIPFGRMSGTARKSATSDRSKNSPLVIFGKIKHRLCSSNCLNSKTVRDQVVQDGEPEPQAIVSGDSRKHAQNGFHSRMPIPPPSIFRRHLRSKSNDIPDAPTPSPSSPMTTPESRDLPDPPSEHMIKKGNVGFQNPLEPPVVFDERINYYDILECDQSATMTEIKASYHRLAKMYHPDRSSGSHELFQEIKVAFDILGDPINRHRYDTVKFGGVLEP